MQDSTTCQKCHYSATFERVEQLWQHAGHQLYRRHGGCTYSVACTRSSEYLVVAVLVSDRAYLDVAGCEAQAPPLLLGWMESIPFYGAPNGP